MAAPPELPGLTISGGVCAGARRPIDSVDPVEKWRMSVGIARADIFLSNVIVSRLIYSIDPLG